MTEHRVVGDSHWDYCATCRVDWPCLPAMQERDDEIEALRATVLSLGEFVMEIDHNPCDHAWEYLSDPVEIAAAKRAATGSDEYQRASAICARHTDDDHADDQYRPCSASFIEARANCAEADQ